MKSGSHFQHTGNTPLNSNRSLGRSRHSGKKFEQRRFPGAVCSDHTNPLTFINVKRNVLKRHKALSVYSMALPNSCIWVFLPSPFRPPALYFMLQSISPDHSQTILFRQLPHSDYYFFFFHHIFHSLLVLNPSRFVLYRIHKCPLRPVKEQHAKDQNNCRYERSHSHLRK